MTLIHPIRMTRKLADQEVEIEVSFDYRYEAGGLTPSEASDFALRLLESDEQARIRNAAFDRFEMDTDAGNG